MTNLPGHLWRDKWTALSGPLSGRGILVDAQLVSEVPAQLLLALHQEDGEWAECSHKGGQYNSKQDSPPPPPPPLPPTPRKHRPAVEQNRGREGAAIPATSAPALGFDVRVSGLGNRVRGFGFRVYQGGFGV